MPVHGWKGGSRKHIQKSVALQKKLYYSYTLLYQQMILWLRQLQFLLEIWTAWVKVYYKLISDDPRVDYVLMDLADGLGVARKM